MRVLVLGGGGREHALAWKLAAGDGVTGVATAPGNPGTENLGPRLDLPITDPDAAAAGAAGYDLVVVGPEAPLAAGVVDALTASGIPTFGPGREAARLESSKAFAKQVMTAARVPTGHAAAFHTEATALAHLARTAGPFVVKADGLAAGKGVLVTDDRAEAASWVRRCLEGGFGEAGRTVLIEEYLEGPEVSLMAICAGDTVLSLAPARDHKRLGDGDTGPNTGGMGCYSPVEELPDHWAKNVEETVLRPVLAAMAERGTPYRGFLYAGLVLTADGPRVLEFNCRMGDPEAQVILPRLESDLAAVLIAAAGGEEPPGPLTWSPGAAVDVVLAAAGYPESPRRGDPIAGLDDLAGDILVFHAGTARDDSGALVTSGGRVLNLVGLGPDLAAAAAAAYAAAGRVRFPGMQYRRDIAGGVE